MYASKIVKKYKKENVFEDNKYYFSNYLSKYTNTMCVL